MTLHVLVIVGPTASGKTRLGVEVAHRLGSEIVSADSRQVYRGLDIGTGKDLEEYARVEPPVPYHLIDIADPEEVYTLFRYQEDCYRVLGDLAERAPFAGERGPAPHGGWEWLVRRSGCPRLPPRRCADGSRGEGGSRTDSLSPNWLNDCDARRRRSPRPPIFRSHAASSGVSRSPRIRSGRRCATARRPRRHCDWTVVGVAVERGELRTRIGRRLRQRLEEGMIDEVRHLLDRGVSRRRLDELDDYLMGDPTRLRQVIVNLVSNALKFTEQGEVKISVEVISSNTDDVDLKIAVSDTGIGIPQQAQKTLFNAFTQADGSTTRKYGGTGLGLAIVSQLVDMMDGTLGVDSIEGDGSSFWFIARFQRTKERPEIISDQVADKEPVQWHAKILLVEDNPINQMVAQKMLEKVGLKPQLANNGLEALKLLNEQAFDLVLMDCQMPEMDGFDATREIRKLGIKANNNKVLPVIAMTANVMSGDRERCLDVGMDDYIGKPVQREQLESVLGKWLA